MADVFNFDFVLNIKDWNPEPMTGYKPITTFYTDFSIAEMYGVEGIQDTFNRAFEEWKHDYKYLTELVMVLNWKSWEHSGTNDEFSAKYVDLYYEASDYGYNNLVDEELDYFYRTLD